VHSFKKNSALELHPTSHADLPILNIKEAGYSCLERIGRCCGKRVLIHANETDGAPMS